LVNSEQVKPAKNIQIGDRVELSYKSFTKTYEVKGFLLKRSSATLAQECFVDCTDPEQNQHQRNLHKLAPKRAKGYGRPTKKERRQLEQFREWF
jgi:ribosome-associated heat shock protein Hsp15